MVKENIQWLISNGKSTKFWLGAWFDEPLAFKYKIPTMFHNNLSSKVGDFLKNKIWDIPNNI